MARPRDTLHRGAVWVANKSGEAIPAASLAEVYGLTADGVLLVRKPTADHIAPSRLVVTPPLTSIPAGATETAPATAMPATHPMAEIAYTGDDPTEGDEIGSTEDAWTATPGHLGFRVAGLPDTARALCCPCEAVPPAWKLTTDEASGLVKAKRVELDGTVYGPEIEFPVQTE